MADLESLKVHLAVGRVAGILLQARHELLLVEAANARRRLNLLGGRRLLRRGAMTAAHGRVNHVAGDGGASAEGKALDHGGAKRAEHGLLGSRTGGLNAGGLGGRGRRSAGRRGSGGLWMLGRERTREKNSACV